MTTVLRSGVLSGRCFVLVVIFCLRIDFDKVAFLLPNFSYGLGVRHHNVGLIYTSIRCFLTFPTFFIIFSKND